MILIFQPIRRNNGQAKTSFMDIYNILENPKWKEKMKKNFRWNREEIVNKKTNSHNKE